MVEGVTERRRRTEERLEQETLHLNPLATEPLGGENVDVITFTRLRTLTRNEHE